MTYPQAESERKGPPGLLEVASRGAFLGASHLPRSGMVRVAGSLKVLASDVWGRRGFSPDVTCFFSIPHFLFWKIAKLQEGSRLL